MDTRYAYLFFVSHDTGIDIHLFPWSSHGENRTTAFNTKGMDYKPPVQSVLPHSKNAVVARLARGVVLKHSRYAWWHHPECDDAKDANLASEIESKILRVLWGHPRIVQ